MRRHRLSSLLVLLALVACSASRNRGPRPASGGRAERTLTVTRDRPLVPVGRIDEAPLDATPAPAATAPPASEPAAAFTSMEPEPLVHRIDASTPPNVAAALQLIEQGRRLQERGGRNQAREQFERAVAIDPTNAYGYFFLARVHFFNRNYDQAIAFASRAVALGTRLDPAWLGRVYALQGAVFEEAGRYPDARDAYRRAVATDPNNLAAQVGLARIAGDGGAAAP